MNNIDEIAVIVFRLVQLNKISIKSCWLDSSTEVSWLGVKIEALASSNLAVNYFRDSAESEFNSTLLAVIYILYF